MQILAIGNSFSQDATRYLHQIARADGIHLTVVNLYIGGCPLEQHFRNAQRDTRDYELQINGHPSGFKTSIKEALLSRSWDVVTLQQASGQSMDFANYTPYIEWLADYVRTLCPKAKLVVHQTWAYEEGSARILDHSGQPHTAVMMKKIHTAYQKAAKATRADGLIPAGDLMLALWQNGVEKVHRDGFHATKGLGRYALGLLWYRTLTGQSVQNNAFCDFDEEIPAEQIALAKNYIEGCKPLF